MNAYGTSAASAKSAAVVPYALPGAPTITAATAGSLAATLTWTAPANGGSAITGYVVTPYIGTVAQTPQTFTGTATTRDRDRADRRHRLHVHGGRAEPGRHRARRRRRRRR